MLKEPKCEELFFTSDSSDEENQPAPLQPRSVSSNDGETLFKNKWHVLNERSNFFKDSKRVAKALLFPATEVNDSVPVGCDEEMAFLVDTSKLRYSEDLTCDENGKYSKASRSKCTITVDENNNVGSEANSATTQTYTLVRKYFRHKDTPEFQRTIYELHLQANGDVHPIVVIRYEWKGQKSELKLTPHGNQRKNSRPYIRARKELIEDLKSSKGSSGQKVVNELYDKQGGIEIQSFASVPRDTRQVYRHNAVGGKGSDFSELLKLNLKGDFVKSIEFSHAKGKGSMPRCVLFTDEQAQDVKRNCCQSGNVLMFDVTFDCGPMFVTIASYRNDQFVNKGNNRSVLMPGPILLHTQKDQDTFRYFGNEISKSLNNASVKFFGTDGESALHKGLRGTESFSDAEHLQCMIHHKGNCEKKLTGLGVKKNAKRILRSIYGEQVEETRYEGLADAESPEEYEAKLATWIQQWDALEFEETGREPEFSLWFQRFKSVDIKKCMLKTLRREAGLGDPPRQFTTNDAESINAMVSRWLKGKKGWDELAKCLHEFVISKYRELEMAVLGIGERQLATPFESLQKTPVEWRKMSRDDKRSVLKQAHLTTELPKSLSIGAEESGVGGFTSAELNDVWQKAETIMASPSNIVPFPNNERQVICFADNSHFTVTKSATDRFSCDGKCRSYAFHEQLLCEHCLAVAESKGLLAEFLVSINTKRNASTVSLVNKALQRQCANSGRKQTTKRKGANNTISCEVKKVVRTPCTPQPFCVARKVGIISRCYGCRRYFEEEMDVPPRDLILRKLDFREWVDKNSGELRRSQCLVPTYYHLKLDCVRMRYPVCQIKDILLHDEVKDQLTEQHMRKLMHFGINVA